MSTAAGAPTNGTSPGVASPQSKDKGKAKTAAASLDVSMEDEDDGEDEDEDDEDQEDEDEDEEMDDEEEDEYEEIDEEINPSAIIGRRTRGLRVDYNSKEALEKAGLAGKSEVEDDDDGEMK